MDFDESMPNSSSPKSDKVDFLNGHILSGIFVPKEVIIAILSFLHFKELENCRLVCRSWRTLIDYVVCIEKLERNLKNSILHSFAIPSKPIDCENIPFYVYSAINKNGFGKNLLKNVFGSGEDPHVCVMDYFVPSHGHAEVNGPWLNNPYDLSIGGSNLLCTSGEDCPKFKHWEVISSGGDGWIVEPVPSGSDPLPEELEERSCFVTSYGSCRKRQIIRLADYGLTSKIMDDLKPYIEISDWYAARFDCGCTYSLKVKLLDSKMETIQDFEEIKSIKQWEGHEWHKICHTFKDYNPGVRYIVFDHAGKDTQFWAGHYGTKIAGSSVIAKVPPTLFE